MTSPDPAAAVAAAYVAQQQAARRSVLAQLAALWAQLKSWRTADADRFAKQAAAIVSGGQQHVAALTVAQQQAAIRAAGGAPGPAPRLRVSDKDVRGVDAARVYRRPFEQIWWDLSQGKPLDAAVASAGARLQAIAATDLQLAKTHASRAVFESSGDVVGYRRVLNGPASCALCVVASTQRYHKGNLLPIHPQCDCGIAPLLGHHPAEQVIDPQLLSQVHAAVRALTGTSDSGARAPDYRQLMIEMTQEHGEMGPLLARPRDRFTGPADLPT